MANILGAGRPEQSWDEMLGSAEVRLAQSERSREISDLGMAGLHMEHPNAFWKEAGGSASQADLARHSRENQEDYCPSLFQVSQVESTTGGLRRTLKTVVKTRCSGKRLGTLTGEPEASLASGESGERLHQCSRWRSRGARWSLSWPHSGGGVCSGVARRMDSGAASGWSVPTLW